MEKIYPTLLNKTNEMKEKILESEKT